MRSALVFAFRFDLKIQEVFRTLTQKDTRVPEYFSTKKIKQT